MQIPKYIEIKDKNGKRTAYLSPQSDGLKDCYADCRLNGNSTLEFSLPATSEKLTELTPECQIWAGGRVYTLLKEDAIDFIRDENNKQWANIMAKEIWNDLNYEYPEPYICNDPTIANPADLTVIIVGGGNDLSGGRYEVGTAGHALYAVLNGSSWSVGTVDVQGIYDLEMEKANRLELIQQIQDIWGGYLIWDSVNKTVSLRAGNAWKPYNGFQIRYAKNLKHITRTQSNKIYTKIYPFGHDDLDIASVNNGKKYITNYSYTSRNYIGIYKNQDIYDAQELKDKATAELELNSRPRYNYKVKIVDLRTLPEYAHEDFSLGDMADIIDPSAGNANVRILRYKYNVFQPWDCEIELGDPEERFIEDVKAAFDTSHFVGGIFNSRGYSSGQSIEDLTITNAKIKNLDAEKITTGYLSADRIKAGSIGADKIKTDELIVGDNIQMGPNATISWGQVEDQPFIPDTDFITTITEDTIMTTNLYARNLTVSAANISGTLEAHQITSDISRVNWSLEVGAPNESGEVILYGSGGDTGTVISGTRYGLDLHAWDGDIYMSAWDNIELDASGLLRLRGGGIDISAWNDDDIILNGYTYLWSSSSEDNRIATWGDLDDLESSIGAGNVIKPYYSANWFHLDYSSGSTIAVRDKNGTFVGYLDIRTS